MKKLVLILFVIMIAGCGKKEEKLEFKCERVSNYDNFTLKEVVGYYSDKEGKASKITYMEDYIPSNEGEGVNQINTIVEEKKEGLKVYEKVDFNVENSNNKTFVDYSLDFTSKNVKLFSEAPTFSKYMSEGLFLPDVYIADLVAIGYTCE